MSQKNISQKQSLQMIEKQLTRKLKSIRSFSPEINKNLNVGSLKSSIAADINLCLDLLKVNIGTQEKPDCKPYNNPEVTKLLLHNLKATKHIDAKKFLPPKQILANCWFNTMFVAFFFSDKGRRFFRFFRELMITGKKVSGEPIKENLAQLFFALNLFIEASYNQFNIGKSRIKTKKSGKTSAKKSKKANKDNGKKAKSKTKKKRSSGKGTNALFDQLLLINNNLNTNFFIYNIYEIIKNPKSKLDSAKLLENKMRNFSLPNVKEAGNPLQYYETIFDYLHYNVLKLMKTNLHEQVNLPDILSEKFMKYDVIPDIIILEDFQSKTQFDKEYTFNKNGNSYKYVLDSIILTNKGHFDPDENSHFVSVLTINKEEYKFDGDSYSRLSKFKWKNLINRDKDWTFKENPNFYPEKYNFTKGYKIMFYYRS